MLPIPQGHPWVILELCGGDPELTHVKSTLERKEKSLNFSLTTHTLASILHKSYHHYFIYSFCMFINIPAKVKVQEGQNPIYDHSHYIKVVTDIQQVSIYVCMNE